MNFSISEFFDTNKRIIIWTVFFVLLFLLRSLFGLVFLTFILCYIFNNLVERLTRRTRLPRRLWTVLVYLVFVALVVTVVAFVAPKLGVESTNFVKQLPETIDKMHIYLDKLGERQPDLGPVLARIKEGLSLTTLVGMEQQTAVSILVKSVNQVTHYFSYFLLGTLFSFLILLDYPSLKSRTMQLRRTRLREVYEETSDSVVQFALTVGAAFQAQVLIAVINTFLTSMGLWGLGIHPIVILATIVFFAGLIPVLGVFISSVPILLLGFNQGGFSLLLGATAMIIVVHAVEAYILNPNIFSAVFKINPVLTLIILYLGHRLFGLWGVILGVPVTVYVYRHTILGQRPNLPPLEDSPVGDLSTRP
jgi:predicted PurR-regulated permease PerM